MRKLLVRVQMSNQVQHGIAVCVLDVTVLTDELSSGNRTQGKGLCWDLVWALPPTF